MSSGGLLLEPPVIELSHGRQRDHLLPGSSDEQIPALTRAQIRSGTAGEQRGAYKVEPTENDQARPAVGRHRSLRRVQPDQGPVVETQVPPFRGTPMNAHGTRSVCHAVTVSVPDESTRS